MILLTLYFTMFVCPIVYRVSEVLKGAKVGDQLKHVLNPHFGEFKRRSFRSHSPRIIKVNKGHDHIAVLYIVYGSALLSHCLIGAGFSDTVKVGAGFDLESGKQRLTSLCTVSLPA
jgi:hypothetical protein